MLTLWLSPQFVVLLLLFAHGLCSVLVPMASETFGTVDTWVIVVIV